MITLEMIQKRLPIREINRTDMLATFVHIQYANGESFEQKCTQIDLDKGTATVWVDNFSHHGGLKDITIPADMKIGIEFNGKIYF